MPDQKSSKTGGSSRSNAIILGLVVLAAAAGGYAYYTMSGDKPGEAAAVADTSGGLNVDPAKDNIMGEANAPVTVVEYSSLTCPHCASFHQMTVPDLKEKYVKTGKVRYVIREFPLDRLAFAAAALARCAGSDKFFPFVSALYKQQENWAHGEGDASQRLFNMAKQVGFTQETFNKCLENKDVIEHIEETRRKGTEQYGVTSTPTIFVNGKKIEGGNTLTDLEKAMEPYLKG